MRCACYCKHVTAESALHYGRLRSQLLLTISCVLLMNTLTGALDCTLIKQHSLGARAAEGLLEAPVMSCDATCPSLTIYLMCCGGAECDA